MYYHIIVEFNIKDNGKTNLKKLFEYDIENKDKILEELIIPFVKKESIQFKGYFLEPNQVLRIAIKKTDVILENIVIEQQSKISKNVLFIWTKDKVVASDELTTDITTEIFKEAKDFNSNKVKNNSSTNISKSINKNDVFIVHGHDDSMKLEVARFIEQLDLKPIILHEQVNEGLTIIEKLEKHTEIGFGIILYSPDDIGSENNQNDNKKFKLRARQNVIFEHGYLIAKIGRHNVCALVKDDIEKPSDITGIIYIKFSDNAWKIELSKELKNAGYKFDLNKIL